MNIIEEKRWKQDKNTKKEETKDDWRGEEETSKKTKHVDRKKGIERRKGEETIKNRIREEETVNEWRGEEETQDEKRGEVNRKQERRGNKWTEGKEMRAGNKVGVTREGKRERDKEMRKVHREKETQ